MSDHKSFVAGIDPATRADLTKPRNRPGLVHLAGHLGVIAVLGTWITTGAWGWPIAVPLLGVALAFLFTLQHECTHATPFRSAWLNTVVGHATGVILIQPFYWFRAFHMAHHKYTNLPGKDPELSGPKPKSWSELAWHLIGVDYWRAKIATLAVNARGGGEEPYLSDRMRPRIRGEAGAMITLYTLALIFSLVVSPILFWVWLLPLVFGFPVLRLYLLAEHGGCPPVANMFENSRTTLTNRVVYFLAWNMPYHAEHHAWPTVPFHNLPEVHALASGYPQVVTEGYARFARDFTEDFRARAPLS
ncbi:MAG: fatty acid desaturase [Rhodobacteraceae bacterium]|nr:fatty acid desaturase [Paracoccaceae bacterium]